MRRLGIHFKFAKTACAGLAFALLLSAAAPAASAAEIDDGFVSVTADAGSVSGDSSLPSSYNTEVAASASELPISYSSKDLGLVTDIKSQVYSSCWAYSGVSVFETKLIKEGFAVTEFSADHANARNITQSNGLGWQRTYTSGGRQCIFPGYLASWQGCFETSALSGYTLSSVSSSDDVPVPKVQYTATAIRYIEDYDTDEIKQAIMDNGSVDTSYSTTSNCFNSAQTMYYMPQSYTGSSSGHSICIVGWDDNLDKSNFANSTGVLPQNNGAWLVRNSWGNNNSLGGYFWISYEDKYIFGEKYNPSYTIDAVAEIEDGTSILQNERYGATYSFNYVDNGDITFINAFDFTSDTNSVQSVTFECRSKGAEYKIYYIPVSASTPSKDESEWTLLASGTVSYSGYITTSTDGRTVPIGRGAIGVRITTSDGGTAELGVGEWLTSSGNYVFLNDSNKNDSSIYYDGTMTDLLDWYQTNNNDSLGGTFVIKATASSGGDEMWGDVDLDGKVSIADVTMLQKYLARLVTLNDVQLKNAQCGGNDSINITDATTIQKYLARII